MEITLKGITCRYNNLVNKVLFFNQSPYLISTPCRYKEEEVCGQLYYGSIRLLAVMAV
jgi:hypothetical protein